MNSVSKPQPLGTVYAAAIQGDRSQQQDAIRIRWLADEAAWLLVLADGMGGHAAGDLASRIAVDSFVGAFATTRGEHASLEKSFGSALEEANCRISAMQSARRETRGMGTTLVAAHISKQGLRWISVGDSPLMIYREGIITRLNEDHSLRGLNAEARGPAAANMLVSALSGEAIAKIDLRIEPLPLALGDTVIVASDGIFSLSDAQIADVIATNFGREVDATTEALLHSVRQMQQPHQDNCTIAMFSQDTDGASARAPRISARAWWGGLLAALACIVLIVMYRRYVQG